MTTLTLCLIILMLIPLTLAVSSIPVRIRQTGKIDVRTPRLQSATLTGTGHRLDAAQSNAWEALLLFVTTLAIVSMSGTPLSSVSLPASLFVAARVVHSLCYIANLAIPRTLSFFLAIGMLVWMLLEAI